jgi:hypothetical protein
MNCSTGDEWRVSENDQPCVTENETIVNNTLVTMPVQK